MQEFLIGKMLKEVFDSTTFRSMPDYLSFGLKRSYKTNITELTLAKVNRNPMRHQRETVISHFLK